MTNSPEQILAAQKAQAEVLFNLAGSLFAGAERMLALNIETARGAFEDSVATSKALMGVKDPQDLVKLQATTMQPAVEKAVAYARNAYEIAVQTNDELVKQFEAQYSDLNKGVVASLDKLAKNSPAGSDVAVAAVKSALAAANSAYDSLNKAARQVTEAAQANVVAMTNATVKAANVAQPKGKRAA